MANKKLLEKFLGLYNHEDVLNDYIIYNGKKLLFYTKPKRLNEEELDEYYKSLKDES